MRQAKLERIQDLLSNRKAEELSGIDKEILKILAEQEEAVMVVPYVPKKTLLTMLRTLVFGEFKLTRESFVKMMEQRADSYFASEQFNRMVENRIAQAFGARWNNTTAFREHVSKSVEKKLDEMVGSAVRSIVAENLPQLLKKIK